MQYARQHRVKSLSRNFKQYRRANKFWIDSKSIFDRLPNLHRASLGVGSAGRRKGGQGRLGMVVRKKTMCEVRARAVAQDAEFYSRCNTEFYNRFNTLRASRR